MAKRKPQPEPHCIFNDPNTPEQWEKFFVNSVTDKVIKIVSKYP